MVPQSSSQHLISTPIKWIVPLTFYTSGMVGLQRPQGDPGLKPEDLEEDNKMICLSNTDEFVLKQVRRIIIEVISSTR